MDRNYVTGEMNIKENQSILEIGPLNRPAILSQNVSYFDLVGTEGLRVKAAQEGLDPSSVPEITFHNPHGDLSGINMKFDRVFSAHVLEHQPNLIKHLKQVETILKQLGEYWLIIPDKRYCFDHFLPESKISDVLAAYEEERLSPNKFQVIEHRALTTHNDPEQHWQGVHGEELVNFEERTRSAIREFELSKGAYIDVHCWQFTPKSLSVIIEGLRKLSLTNFEVKKVYDTPRNDLEFCVVLGL